jgi:beta-glucosidase
LLLGLDKAHATEGLTAQVYNVLGQNGSPYIPQGTSPVVTTNVPNIDFQWGSGSVLGGPSEDVIVVFTGSILSNITQNISFLATGDDGTKLYVDGINITNDWVDKGGGGTTSAPVAFTAGVPKSIQLMYYENGGGANVLICTFDGAS